MKGTPEVSAGDIFAQSRSIHMAFSYFFYLFIYFATNKLQKKVKNKRIKFKLR